MELLVCIEGRYGARLLLFGVFERLYGKFELGVCIHDIEDMKDMSNKSESRRFNQHHKLRCAFNYPLVDIIYQQLATSIIIPFLHSLDLLLDLPVLGLKS